jgi:hypothetical protein
MTCVLPFAGNFRRPFGRLAPTGMVRLNTTENLGMQFPQTDDLPYFDAHTTLLAGVRKGWQKAQRMGVLAGIRPASLEQKAQLAPDGVAPDFYNPYRSMCCRLSPSCRRRR